MPLKKIAIRMQNVILAEGIIMALRENGNFIPYKLSAAKMADTVTDCEALHPDILLMSVSYSPEENIERCLAICEAVHKSLPKCKTVFICDENSYPDLARKVVSAKENGIIDSFFYSSVSGKYLSDALYAL